MAHSMQTIYRGFMMTRHKNVAVTQKTTGGNRFLLAALLLPLAIAASAQEFDNARNAYLSGDYESALTLAHPMAESGDADAQVLLSLMYDNGQGVPQDTRKATEWLQRAADGGNSNARNDLELRY